MTLQDHRNHHLKPLWGLLAACLLLGACSEKPSGPQSLKTLHEGKRVAVTFYGERSSSSLFGPEAALTDQVRPLTRTGEPEGEFHEKRPDWLEFEYRINNESRRVLVAKQPVMNQVSWWGIARAGAALGDDSELSIQGRRYRQSVRIEDRDGNEYRLRLLSCGGATMAHLSEWNLLIGGVHEGDKDFRGARYGWIERPYTNSDLKVGLEGSLSWCGDRWEEKGHRVTRGYYFVSRFHAAPAHISSDRLYWRPVLERIEPTVAERPLAEGAQRSPDGRLDYLGVKSNTEIFGADQSLADRLGFTDGERIGKGEPEWLTFEDEGKRKLVAAKPLAHSLSWDRLDEAGLVNGADTRVSDQEGRRYRVRLLECGESTLDHESEWNRLIGGVAQPDGDFARYPSVYGWIEEPLHHGRLHIGSKKGSASWCQEGISLYGKHHGVNRGYLVPSRHHATSSGFTGWGFGWRPVLEQIEDQ